MQIEKRMSLCEVEGCSYAVRFLFKNQYSYQTLAGAEVRRLGVPHMLLLRDSSQREEWEMVEELIRWGVPPEPEPEPEPAPKAHFPFSDRGRYVALEMVEMFPMWSICVAPWDAPRAPPSVVSNGEGIITLTEDGPGSAGEGIAPALWATVMDLWARSAVPDVAPLCAGSRM